MHFTGPIYRPPVEAMLGTELLQVTVGCAHNRCHFCTMYRSAKFKIEPLDQIEADLKELRMQNAHIRRIFLINGDAFVLSARRLKEIATLIIRYIPEVEVITMYASMNNVKAKTDEELRELRDLRINDLWMGTETGNAEAIQLINKGHELKDVYEQLERLNQAGIRHCHGLMLGVAGAGKGIQNAIDSAKLLNKVNPTLIWFGTLGLFDGSEMKEAAQKGEFTQATEREIIEEEIKVLELLDVKGVPFYGIHPTNTNSIQGMLPDDKNAMITQLKHYLATTDPAFLDSSKPRHSL